jgi:hypothetical protein
MKDGLLHLSECATKYANAIANPFSSKALGACVPDVLSLPSSKYTFRSQSFLFAGTQGFAYVAFNPWLLLSNGIATTATGTQAPIVSSLATYAAGATPATFNTAGIGATSIVAPSNSSFTPAQLLAAGTNYQFRLVGAGLRVRYTGTELNRGGRYTFFRSPTNTIGSCQSLGTAGALLNNAYHTVAVGREWREICYAPTKQSDLQYNAWVDPSVTAASDYRVMCCLVDGTSAGNTFEYEAIAHFEMQSDQVALPMSPSHSDPVGFGAVLSSIPPRLITKGADMLAAVANGAMRTLGRSVSGYVTTAGASFLGGMLGGPTGARIAGAIASSSQTVTVEDAD